MVAFSDWYFSFNPYLRGVIAALTAFIAVEVVKPNFAYAATEEGYVPRPFGKGAMVETMNEEVVEGTSVPWWTIPVGIAFIFGIVI
jgi:hypothetical protein